MAPGVKFERRVSEEEDLTKSSGRDAHSWQREQQVQRQEIGGDLAVSEAQQEGQGVGRTPQHGGA